MNQKRPQSAQNPSNQLNNSDNIPEHPHALIEEESQDSSNYNYYSNDKYNNIQQIHQFTHQKHLEGLQDIDINSQYEFFDEEKDSLLSKIQEQQSFDEYKDIFEEIGVYFAQNKVNQALDICQETLEQGYQEKGPQGFTQLFNKIIKYLNNQALNSLNIDQFEKSLIILYKCKQLTDIKKFSIQSTLRALVLNNFGCYYRRLHKLPAALGYLEQSLRFLNKIQSREYLGTTYLNISAILSEMGEHYASLENAKKSVLEFHKDYSQYLSNKPLKEARNSLEFIEICQGLAISFYNVGVEQEYFQNYEICLINYGKACEVSEDNLGNNHRLTRRFKQLFLNFNEKLIKAEKTNKSHISKLKTPKFIITQQNSIRILQGKPKQELIQNFLTDTKLKKCNFYRPESAKFDDTKKNLFPLFQQKETKQFSRPFSAQVSLNNSKQNTTNLISNKNVRKLVRPVNRPYQTNKHKYSFEQNNCENSNQFNLNDKILKLKQEEQELQKRILQLRQTEQDEYNQQQNKYIIQIQDEEQDEFMKWKQNKQKEIQKDILFQCFLQNQYDILVTKLNNKEIIIQETNKKLVKVTIFCEILFEKQQIFEYFVDFLKQQINIHKKIIQIQNIQQWQNYIDFEGNQYYLRNHQNHNYCIDFLSFYDLKQFVQLELYQLYQKVVEINYFMQTSLKQLYSNVINSLIQINNKEFITKICLKIKCYVARKQIQKRIQEKIEQIFLKVVSFGKHSLFLTVFKQKLDGKFFLEIQSLNKSRENLKKIKCKLEIQKQMVQEIVNKTDLLDQFFIIDIQNNTLVLKKQFHSAVRIQTFIRKKLNKIKRKYISLIIFVYKFQSKWLVHIKQQQVSFENLSIKKKKIFIKKSIPKFLSKQILLSQNQPNFDIFQYVKQFFYKNIQKIV